MAKTSRWWVWLLLCGVLTACATTPSSAREEEAGCETAGQAVSFEEACEEEGSLLAVCDAQQCAEYRCREVAEYFRGGQVVRTQGVIRPPPGPQPGTDARRNWGSAQGLPQRVRPVFTIPWGNTSPPLLTPGQVELLVSRNGQWSKPYERHHIYPQEKELKTWFEGKGIDIHQWTLALEVEEHRRSHRGPNGGPWNEAWRRYKNAHFNATKLEIELHAGQLIYEFNLYGVVVPYRRQLLRLPSNLLAPD
jgi:uncharacterized lipoprotein (TIGR02269 family)